MIINGNLIKIFFVEVLMEEEMDTGSLGNRSKRENIIFDLISPLNYALVNF